jgi:hypothetical protein
MYVQAGRVIFRLEHQETISRAGQAQPESVVRPDGTAFVIAHDSRLYLVTARHVAEQSSNGESWPPPERTKTI